MANTVLCSFYTIQLSSCSSIIVHLLWFIFILCTFVAFCQLEFFYTNADKWSAKHHHMSHKSQC